MESLMRKDFSQGLIISFIFLSTILFINTRYIYAGMLSHEAESYRIKGYEDQEKGDIDSAINWYQKAANLDTGYAAPHNDLGILYEAKGWLDRAESEYQKALTIEPGYEKAHTNIALLYERKGETEKAAFHWMKRYRLGKPSDPWTNEARERLEKLGLVDEVETKEIKARRVCKPKKMPARERGAKKAKAKRKPKAKAKRKTRKKEPSGEWTRIGSGSREEPKRRIVKKTEKRITKPPRPKKSDLDKELQDALRLAEKRLREQRRNVKAPRRKESRKQKTPGRTSGTGARGYYQKAKNYSEKGEYVRALDTIRSAKKDYPKDPALLGLEESIKNKMKEERIEDHYNEGLMHYRKEDFSSARKEFEAMLNILPE